MIPEAGPVSLFQQMTLVSADVTGIANSACGLTIDYSPILNRTRFGTIFARVAELADALDSKSSSRKGVGVRFPPLVLDILNKISEKDLR